MSDATEDVMEQMRTRYSTLPALRSKTSMYRNHYSGALDEQGLRAKDDMLAACHTDAERKLVALFVADYGRTMWKDVPNNDELNAVVYKHRLALLPQHVRNVRLTAEETNLCKKMARANLNAKHNQSVVVNGDALYEWVKTTLCNHATIDLYELILALLVATGRRTTEVCNGKSRFQGTEEGCHFARFSGQIKLRKQLVEEEDEPYVIPLMVPQSVVSDALVRLRQQQPDDIHAWTHARVSSRYQSGLGQYLQRSRLKSFIQGKITVHSLRSVYALMVAKLFTTPPHLSTVAVAQRVCGHRFVSSALAYTAVNVNMVHNVGCLGAMPLLEGRCAHTEGDP